MFPRAAIADISGIQPELPRRLVGARVGRPLFPQTAAAHGFGLFGSAGFAGCIRGVGMENLLPRREPPQVGEHVVAWIVVDVVDGLTFLARELEGDGDQPVNAVGFVVDFDMKSRLLRELLHG